MKAETLLPLGKLDPGLEAPEQPYNLSDVEADAACVDRLGYYALLMEETKQDPFQVLALASRATSRVRLGTSVAIAFARSPFVVAQAAWTLQSISGGRFELGLGSQVRGHMQRRFGIRWQAPGPWMRSYVGALRALWHAWQSQTPVEYDSAHYQLNLNVPLFTPAPIEHPHIPVFVAAVNPYMCQVAAEVADGVRLHPVCSADYIRDTVLPRIGNRPGFEVALKPLIATAADDSTLSERREVARRRLAFYAATPAYRKAFQAVGQDAVCEPLSELARTQRWSDMAAYVNDDMLNRWVVVARYDDLADALLRRYGGLIQRVEVSIPVESPMDEGVLREVILTLQAAV